MSRGRGTQTVPAARETTAYSRGPCAVWRTMYRKPSQAGTDPGESA